MGLLSIFKRQTDAKAAPATVSPAPGGVQQARARARQRLVGAVVLVVAGVIAFPLLFESQPRPIPVDIPIEIPRKDGAPALVMPPARAVTPVTEAAALPAKPVGGEAKVEASASGGAAPASAPAEAAAPVAVPAPAPVLAPPTTPKKPVVSEPIELPKKASASSQAAAAAPAPAPLPAADAARAKALLEGKPPAAGNDGARFVVQVGAFAEASAAQDTRAKVDKLGLKSYTQVTETAAGNRIRVRLGPFATREEAERVLAKAKAAGINGVVLTL